MASSGNAFLAKSVSNDKTQFGTTILRGVKRRGRLLRPTTKQNMKTTMNKSTKIYIAGHQGMVGSAIWRNLESKGYKNLIGRTFEELDLIRQKDVEEFFEKERPEYVFVAAAKVGGIVANNTYRAQFIYENLMIQNNIIHSAHVYRVKKLLFLGSSCIYPKMAPQPMKEEYLLTGELEPTNEPYAIAKIAGIKMCENYYRQYGDDFISVMPTNLYGPNDNYDLEKSHVLPALIRKMHLGKCMEQNDWNALRSDLNKRPIEGISGDSSEDQILEVLAKYGIRREEGNQVEISEAVGSDYQSKNKSSYLKYPKVTVTLWGTGNVHREFLHVDDMADACIFLIKNYTGQQFFNIGCGEDITVKDLARIIQEIVYFKGKIIWDTSKPNGTPRKLLSIAQLENKGWSRSISLESGISEVYKGYVNGI